MRFESSATALSWIPSEAIEGLTRLPFEVGLTHYDDPPPDVLEDLEELQRSDRYRFANHLRAWIEVVEGEIVDYGQEGGGWIGSSTVRVGPRSIVFEAVPFPDLRPEPVVERTSVRFVQTAGGRTGMPAPRRITRKPFVRLTPPLAWSTLALTMHADGRAEPELAAASPFPRHWLYDHRRQLVAKTGMIDFRSWYRHGQDKEDPWRSDHPAPLVTDAESALERALSGSLMRGTARPRVFHLDPGQALVRQGEAGGDVYVLLDGVLTVEVDGEPLAELGPGAVVGERALLEGGRRTATLRAATRVRVAASDGGQVPPQALQDLATGHRREESRQP